MGELSAIKVVTIDGDEKTFGEVAGKYTLVVNVASKCGFTPQYRGLESLYRKFKDRGLSVLGFPCNQFAGQEPGDEEDIKSFCSTTYDVTFPMFEKVEVNGAGTHPLYKSLKKAAPGLLGTEAVKWNFTKFLVDGKGAVVKRYGPNETPETIGAEIEKLL